MLIWRESPLLPFLVVSTYPALTKCNRTWKPNVDILTLACDQQILSVFKINAALPQLFIFPSEKVL